MLQRFFFRKNARLLTSQDYSNVFKNSTRKFVSNGLIGLALPTPSEPGRLGVIVSKKNVRRAVGRNRFKRIVRESFRLNQTAMAGLDVVVLARGPVNKIESKALLELLEKLWAKLSL